MWGAGPGSPRRVPSQPSPPVLLSACQEAALSDAVLAPSCTAALASMHLKYLKQCSPPFVNPSGFFLKQYHSRGKHFFVRGGEWSNEPQPRGSAVPSPGRAFLRWLVLRWYHAF